MHTNLEQPSSTSSHCSIAKKSTSTSPQPLCTKCQLWQQAQDRRAHWLDLLLVCCLIATGWVDAGKCPEHNNNHLNEWFYWFARRRPIQQGKKWTTCDNKYFFLHLQLPVVLSPPPSQNKTDEIIWNNFQWIINMATDRVCSPFPKPEIRSTWSWVM